VDVSNLEMFASLRISDLPHSDTVKFLNAEDATVAHVVSIREEAPTAAEAELAAAAAAAAEAAAATPAEPEVARKGGKPEDTDKKADAGGKKPEAKK
jgi:large subunit ribosomal protein L25